MKYFIMFYNIVSDKMVIFVLKSATNMGKGDFCRT